MRELFFFFVIALSIPVKSQSIFNKSIDASNLTELFVNLDHTFQIEITNTSENKIIISARSEGEYQNNISINTKRREGMLNITDDIQPFSSNHNDKLSAHKVIVLHVKIQVPKNLKITLQSRIASLLLDGEIQSLFVELHSGECILRHFTGNATVNTLDGDIVVHTKNAVLNASTKLGTLYKEEIYGPYLIDLKTISGNISVYKTK